MGNIKIIRGVFETNLELERASVVAGFPSPADDYMHETLDFNRDYIKHPEASFYGEVEGDSKIDDPDNFKVWGTVIHLIRTFETV